MSIYTLLNGQPSEEESRRVESWFSWKIDSFPRFRDLAVNPSEPRVVVLTRTGGGNREEYEEENEALTRLEGYLRNSDADFDDTYAEWEYEIPEKSRENWKAWIKEKAEKRSSS